MLALPLASTKGTLGPLGAWFPAQAERAGMAGSDGQKQAYPI